MATITKENGTKIEQLEKEIIRLKRVDLTIKQSAKLRKLSEEEVIKKVNIASHCLSLIDKINSTDDDIKKECHLLAMTKYLGLVNKQIIED